MNNTYNPSCFVLLERLLQRPILDTPENRKLFLKEFFNQFPHLKIISSRHYGEWHLISFMAYYIYENRDIYTRLITALQKTKWNKGVECYY